MDGQRQYAGLWSALTGIAVNATPGDDIVEIDNTATGTPVTINLGDGTDTVEIGLAPSDLGAIQSPVTIHGGSGPDILTLEDTLSVSDTSYTVMGSTVLRTGSAMVSYDHIRQLVIRGGSVSDVYNVVGPTPSAVQIMAGSGSNTVTIDDRSNAADTTYTVAGLSVARTGSAAISFAANGGSITNRFINGGDGNNTYNVQSTPSGSSTTLNTGDGVDAVNVQGTTGALFINGGSGGDTITLSNSAATLGGIGRVIINDPSNNAAVTVDDSGSTDSTVYTVTSTRVTAAAWPNFLLVYNNLASLNLNGGSGDDCFTIESTAGVTVTTISAGSGSNRFDLAPTDQYLADIAGALNLSGSGADTLVFWDTANPNAETYTFDDIPSMLTLAMLPDFATSWSGISSIYLETNGMSTVDDPSGTVQVDVPPPSAPSVAQPPLLPPFRAGDDSLVRAWLAAAPPRPRLLPAVCGVDLLPGWTQKPSVDGDLPVWVALDG